MKLVTCATCHDPHAGVLYNDVEGAQAIRIECEACHDDARTSLQSASLAAFKGDFECIECHMPFETRTAVKRGTYVADIRTHIFKINSDTAALPFSSDGALANPYVTLEFACLGCHTDKNKAWADQYAKEVHGPNFSALPALTAEIR